MANVELSTAIAREHILSECLLESGAIEKYDFILLDCPPPLGLMTLNALAVATNIIPMVSEVLPFKELTMMKDFVAMAQHRLNQVLIPVLYRILTKNQPM